MRTVGKILLIVGVLVACFALFVFDTAVVTIDGSLVNNIGLMSDRQNLIIVGGFVFIAGLLILLFGAKDSRNLVNCPECKELVIKDATICKHCGVKLTPNWFGVKPTPNKEAPPALQEAKKMLECRTCHSTNELNNLDCWKCGEKLN
jgi:RNA polymerase subunit RPABC4/transcription elongation factor Spt4